MTNEIPALAPLETFGAETFKGDDEYPQELCDFVLSLSLAYNDIRDATQAIGYAVNAQDSMDGSVTTEMGLIAGVKNSLIRVQFGFVRELLGLIQDNVKILDHPNFSKLIHSLSPKVRDSWSSLLDAANEREAKNRLTKTLILFRNHVGFHYDSRQLGRGYELAFLSDSKVIGYQNPFVSRGKGMYESRFYFADAAAQAYMNERVTAGGEMEFIRDAGSLLTRINFALFHVITSFIGSRSALKRYDAHA